VGACPPPPDRVTTDIVVFVDLTAQEEWAWDDLLVDDGHLDRILSSVTTLRLGPARLNGGSVTFYPINDHGLLGTGRRARLSVGKSAESKFVRQETIKTFLADATTAYLALLEEARVVEGPEDEEYKRSNIVRPLCQYLATVEEVAQTNHRRHLVLFSDLMEHSPVFSFFEPSRTAADLAEHRQEVAALFRQACGVETLPPAMSYEVIRQPLPKGTASDVQYEAHLIWQSFLTELGIKAQSIAVL
jgi:hypothetical protein